MSTILTIAAGYLASMAVFIFAWSNKPRTSCRRCDLPIGEGSDKYLCLGCIVEDKLNEN